MAISQFAHFKFEDYEIIMLQNEKIKMYAINLSYVVYHLWYELIWCFETAEPYRRKIKTAQNKRYFWKFFGQRIYFWNKENKWISLKPERYIITYILK